MVSNETWMGSGTYVTLAPESELFLGYMPLGPTLGMSNTNKANLIKYSVGYATDGTTVTVGTTATFSDYYELVPDLYTGCIAKFYYTEAAADDGAAHSLKFTAIVAGNDTDAIYFHGNIADFPSLYNKAAPTTANPRGYIVLESTGATIPAPVAVETIDSAVTQMATNDTKVVSIDAGNANKYIQNDIIRNVSGGIIGRVYAGNAASTGEADANLLVATHANPTSAQVELALISASLGTITSATEASTTISTIVTSADLTGKVSAGDWVSQHASTPASGVAMGRVMTTTATSIKVALISAGSGPLPVDAEHIYWGQRMLAAGNGLTVIAKAKPRVLSDNWVGLSNTITTPTVDIEMKQLNLSLGGSRNYSYQYKGMETAANASLDLDLNHGTWLYYALGSVATSATATATTDASTNRFITGASAYSNASSYSNTNASVWVGYDNTDSSAGSQNGKFHRVPNGTSTFCPPLLPTNGASPLTNDPSITNGVVTTNTEITYTFSERNDSTLPTFGLELSQQKGSALTSEPMVDRNSYHETVYAQLYPGCMVNSMTLSANENEAVKTTLDLNVKTAFECPEGYVARMYDGTNNDTNEFKNLFNFGQITNRNADIVQDFITPFYFSDGTISLFGQEFMKVQTFNLTINNTITDKRYVGQYNKRIKMAVPTQRTYEVTMTAQVTDRRIFDELRRESPHRFSLGADDDGSNSKIQLLLTKDTGERIKLQFDDYLISASTWPMADDRGPIYVDFTIMPLRTSTMDAVSHWVMQS